MQTLIRGFVSGVLRIKRNGNGSLQLDCRQSWWQRLISIPVYAYIAWVGVLIATTCLTFLTSRTLGQSIENLVSVVALLGGCLLGITIVVQAIVALFDIVFTRRFVFDAEQSICEYRHIPGFGCTIRFEEIQALQIALRPRRCWLGLCFVYADSRRKVWIHTIAPDSVYPPVLESLAFELTKIIGCPLERHDEHVVKYWNWHNGIEK